MSQMNILERIAPEDIIEPLSITYEKVKEVAIMAGATALPLPIQGLAVTRDQLGVEVLKIVDGVRFVYARLDQRGLSDRKYAPKFKAQFSDGLLVVFGTQAPATNMEMSQRLRSITASWFDDQYGPSWRVNLAAQPWRLEDGGEICAEVLLNDDESWNGICRIPGLPACALTTPLPTAASKPEEAEAMIDYVTSPASSRRFQVAEGGTFGFQVPRPSFPRQ